MLLPLDQGCSFPEIADHKEEGDSGHRCVLMNYQSNGGGGRAGMLVPDLFLVSSVNV